MIVRLRYRGPEADDGSSFAFEAELELTDETAEYAGRDFARLVALAEQGVVDGQRLAYGDADA